MARVTFARCSLYCLYEYMFIFLGAIAMADPEQMLTSIDDVDQCSVSLVHDEAVGEVTQAQLGEAEVQSLAESFKALADPTRIRILSNLIQRELCVCDLAAILGMTQSAVSHQLRTLRMMHIVKNRREGNTVYYTCDDTHVVGLLRMGIDHVAHTVQSATGRRAEVGRNVP